MRLVQVPDSSSALHRDPGLGPGLAGPAAPLRADPALPGPGTEFVAVEGGTGTGAGAGQALVTAYVLMWALLFGFVWLGLRRQRRLEARIAELERSLLDRPEAK
jgi:CcmD family protein